MLRYLEITCKNPFEGIEFEARQSLRYRSQVNYDDLVLAAWEELSVSQPDAFKVFGLAACAGLRRAEIDTLTWTAFLWKERRIRIQRTRHYRLKTETSPGDVPIDEKLLAFFRGCHAKAKSEFVVEPPEEPLIRRSRRGGYSRTTSSYRCEEVFDALSKWLRQKGVTEGKPIHTLRKEYGSRINKKYGIFVASRACRHGSVSITEQFYADKGGAPPIVGVDHLLNSKTDNITDLATNSSALRPTRR